MAKIKECDGVYRIIYCTSTEWRLSGYMSSDFDYIMDVAKDLKESTEYQVVVVKELYEMVNTGE